MAGNIAAGKKEPRFQFRVPLVKHRKASIYILEVPERVSVAIGRRGPVPIVAILNGAVELQASMVPMGGGRHWLQLNARLREELELEVGDNVRVQLRVPEKVPRHPMPTEFADALREADLNDVFAAFPVGKQNHFISWIDEAVHPETREKRAKMAIEWVFRAREKAYDREAKTVKGGRRGKSERG